VKEVHSDGGGEYKSDKLKQFYASKGIKYSFTCANTPQHNSIAERYNRTLFDVARCLLYQSKLPIAFSHYALKAAAYCLQYRPCVMNKEKTCYELFYNIQPSISHLRVFGCDCVLLNTNTRSKMLPRGTKGIFVGYSELQENGYEILVPREYDADILITSRDVQFLEDKFEFGVRCNEYGSTNDVLRSFVRSDRIVNFDEQDGYNVELNNYYESFNTNNQTQLEVVSDHDSSNNTDTESSVTIRRSNRARTQPQRYGQININDVYDEDRHDIAMMIVDPTTVDEALTSEEAKEWRESMDDEIRSLKSYHTWTVCLLPNDRKAVDCKWVYKLKTKSDGSVDRYKSRVCAKGFTQVKDVDYRDTFAPVLKYKSLRLILALATILKYDIELLDVKTAFLNATLKEEVYMKLPKGYEEYHPTTGVPFVCKLNKSIYGLKQASNEWNKEVDSTIEAFGFKRTVSDTCVYWKRSKLNNIIVLAIFVDDIIIIHSTNDQQEWTELKNQFMSKYQMTDNKDSEFILGMKYERNNDELHLNHTLHIDKTIQRFGLAGCKPQHTPIECERLTAQDRPTSIDEINDMKDKPYRSLVGNVLYIAISTRPDIAYAVNQVSKYCENPGKRHWSAGKRILRYLKGTSTMGLTYKSNDTKYNSIVLEGYCDADWGGDIDDRKSTSGFVIKINGNTVHWGSVKQQTVALSSAEAELVSVNNASCELMWFASILTELNLLTTNVENPPVLPCDNQSAITISEKDKHTKRTKHIDIKYYAIRELITAKRLQLRYIRTDEQEADIMTKGLSVNLFTKFRNKIMAQSH
jgi:hypothetical protein